ncbi:glycoside hydrolase family 2 TIM barrel-domain containing protein [uncultured Bacteroides sp.]|uniref:glycoside hydrolase family 2 TIM barrel-domain containing protein n=1 Tax=uncultured Bacteroides sp. TaxID=162156 RepID=UPI002AA5F49E|nr:glycoside hydrolase family 2 TIM barrel-domain containing protein [uncultured Bacteroides sp.]
MKKLLTIIIMACSCAMQLQAVVPSSKKIRLNDGWEFIRQDMANAWEVMRPVRTDQPESVPLWSKVTLPHCFNAEDAVDPDANYYQGPGWYRTNLSIDNPYTNGRILLEFEGAGQKSDVYVYTTKVGSHVGGYDGWRVDITDAVKAFSQTTVCKEQFKGKIPIAVRCDNSRDTERIPSSMSDFNVYGGLYRYVNLVYVPGVSFERIKIDPRVDEKGKNGHVDVAVSLYNPKNIATNALLTVVIKDPNGKEVYSNKETVIGDGTTSGINPASGTEKSDSLFSLAELSLKKPMLWNVDDPRLYTCELTLNVNGQPLQVVERFGFRSFEFKEKGPFMLNGKRLLLRGTHRHEDQAGVGAALTEEMMVKEMKMIKDMGINFIRLGHYQQSDIILNLCDKLGILVWEEIPWCRGGLGGDVYKAQARRMLTNMVHQHYNHPAVILWGIGNENDWPGDFPTFSKDSIRSFMTELNDLAHHLDSHRNTCIRRCDFCKDIVDVYSPSIWAGWYSKAYTDYRDMATAAFKGTKRFFHAEWGGDSHAGRHSESDFKGMSNAAKNGDWSETYIIHLFDWHLKEQENMLWLSGSAFWTFKDFSTPLRPDNPIPYVNQKGVVERDLTPKESYYVFQSYWTSKPMIHIYGHTWPVRWGKSGDKKEVLVYSNCPEVELFVNGESQGKKKRNSQDFPAAGFHWEIVYKEGQNRIEAVGSDKKARFTDQISQEYQTETWGKEAQIDVTYAPVEKSDTIMIQAQLKDQKGIRCLDSQKVIEFSLIGDGKLIQNQGTSTGSRKLQAANGRARIRAVVKGKCIILAKSDNIPANFITIFATR